MKSEIEFQPVTFTFPVLMRNKQTGEVVAFTGPTRLIRLREPSNGPIEPGSYLTFTGSREENIADEMWERFTGILRLSN